MSQFSERRMEAMIKACHKTRTHELCGDRLKECLVEIRRLKAFAKTRDEEIEKILRESSLRPERLKATLEGDRHRTVVKPVLPIPKQ